MSNSSIHTEMTRLEWGMLVALSILWGGSFFFNEVAVRELPPLTVVVVRVALAAVILLFAMRTLGLSMPADGRTWAAFFVLGLLNHMIPFSLIVWGQTHIASGLASILNATTPLFTVMVAHAATGDEKLTRGRIFGILCGILGVTLIIGSDAFRSLGIDIAAQGACLLAALSYALAGVFGRWFRRHGVQPLATATGQVAASTLILLPMVLLVDRPWTLEVPSLPALSALVGIGALSTALAYFLYFRVLATAGAVNLLLVTFLIPVSAIVLGILVLGETLLGKHIIGFALIALGLAAIDGRPLARIQERLGDI